MPRITNTQLVEACKRFAAANNPVETRYSNGILCHKDRYGYVCGAKGQLCTQTLLNSLAKSPPSGFDANYFLTRCKIWIGRTVTDCSGMITLAIKTVDPTTA